MRTLLLLILGGLLVAILFRMFRRRRTDAPPMLEETNLAALSITDARVGDTVSIAGMGDDFDDLDLTVDRRNRYESGGDTWYELSGLYRGRRIHVEVYEDDEVEVSITRDEALTLDAVGLTEADLVRMDTARSRSEGFEHDGSRWSYLASAETGYFRDDQGEGEGFYGWEFEEADGTRTLYVEKWEGEPFEAGIAEMVNAADVRVFRGR